MTTTDHEVYALRYASRDDNRASNTYYRFDLYGDCDSALPMDYFFWVIRNHERTVLVDCGYSPERAIQRGRTLTAAPGEILARIDVTPESVDHVVLSHMHFDHIGNTGLFPNATFSIARSEFDFWTGPYADRPTIALAVADEETAAVRALHRDGRLYLVDESPEELYPGIRLITSPGHTPGQLIIDVSHADGNIVLASDAIHYYDEMHLDRPFHLFTDIVGMFRTYELLRSLDARPGTTVVAGHDPAVTSGFHQIADNCLDLKTPTAAAVRAAVGQGESS